MVSKQQLNPAQLIFSMMLQYLTTIDKILAETNSKQEYKTKVLSAYPGYAGVNLIDIYLNFYLKKD